jgi:hypothetical protein
MQMWSACVVVLSVGRPHAKAYSTLQLASCEPGTARLSCPLLARVHLQALREAEVEFYTWDSYVPGPFLQLVTDLCRGGVVFWCSGFTGPGPASSSNKITIRRQVLSSMNQVYEFVTKAVHNLPDHVVKQQQWPAVS